MPAPRIAVLVLAHRTAPLAHLLSVLDDRFSVFVHLDAKTDLSSANLILPPNATLIAPRLQVFWGGWSMMAATLALLDAARAAGDFARYALVSGDALPALPPDALAAALRDESREFIELIPVPDDPDLAGRDMQAAIARHGWVQPWRRYNPVAWDHVLLNPFQREAAASRYGLPQDRTDWIRGEFEAFTRDLLQDLQADLPFPGFWYGAQWWALTAATIEAIRPDLARTDVRRFFRTLQVPDEHMIQTVLANRPSALGGRTVAGTPMFTDPSRPAQRVGALDRAGFRGAAAHGPAILFARKFDPDATPEIAAAIRAGRYVPDVLGL